MSGAVRFTDGNKTSWQRKIACGVGLQHHPIRSDAGDVVEPGGLCVGIQPD